MKYVCLGDSFTAGYTLPKSQCWVSLCHREDDLFINRGIIGDTTGGMLSRLDNLILSERPDAIIIFGGINDFICGIQPEHVAANYMAMIHRAVYHRIKPIIGICPDFSPERIKPVWTDFADFDEVKEKHKWNRTRLLQMAEAFQLDILDLFLLAEDQDSDLDSLLLDGLHLNAKGNKLVSKRILTLLGID